MLAHVGSTLAPKMAIGHGAGGVGSSGGHVQFVGLFEEDVSAGGWRLGSVVGVLGLEMALDGSRQH